MMKPWPVEGFVLARALWLRMMLLEVAAVEACSRRMEKVRLGSFRQEENTFKRHNSGRTMIVYARCTRHTYTYIYIYVYVYSYPHSILYFAEANFPWSLILMSKVYMNLYYICIDQSQDSKLSRFSNGSRTWILSTRGMTSQIQPLELQIFKATKLKHRKKTLLFFQVTNFWAFWSLALVSKTVPFLPWKVQSASSNYEIISVHIWNVISPCDCVQQNGRSPHAKAFTNEFLGKGNLPPENLSWNQIIGKKGASFLVSGFFANVRAFGVLKLNILLLTPINVAFCLFTLEAAPSQTPLSSLSAVLPSEACGSNDASWRSWPSEFVSMNKFRRGLFQRCWFLQKSTGKCKNLTEHLLEWPFVFLDFHTCAVMMQSRQRNNFPTHGRPVPWCLVVVAGGAYLVTGGKHTNVGYI